jgi:hypothetical protein
MADRTLYASTDRKRFFHVPDDAKLPAGDLVVRSLTGKKLEVDPIVLGVYEVPEAEAMVLAQGILGGFAEKLRAVAVSAGKALNAPPRRDPEAVAAREAREARVAESLRISRETLKGDPAAVGEALKATLAGLLATARETVHEPEVAREKMKDVAEALRQEGVEPGAAAVLEELPDRLRELLASEDTVAKLEAAAADLRKAAAELRAARTGETEYEN